MEDLKWKEKTLLHILEFFYRNEYQSDEKYIFECKKPIVVNLFKNSQGSTSVYHQLQGDDVLSPHCSLMGARLMLLR